VGRVRVGERPSQDIKATQGLLIGN
jgi:hypothetical protein